MYQPIKESIQLMTTPTDQPKSVLLDDKKNKMDEFFTIVQNMTQLRFILFILSILLCFVVVIAFLFVVPCEPSTCVSSRKVELLWSNAVFDDIELKGKPSEIDLNQKLLHLVFIARGSILNSQTVPPRTERFPSLGGGLLQIDITTGKEMWRKRLDPLPDKIDCTLLNNQFKENSDVYCIVGASNGNLLGVVASSKDKGTLVWEQTKGRPELNNTKFYTKNDIIYTEFPVIIPDCDADGVNEMALAQHINNMPTLTIVSGKSGLPIINSSIINENCTKMTDLILKYDMSLVYKCHKNIGADLVIVPIKTMLNCSDNWIPDSVRQTKREHDQSEENQYSISLGHYNLSVTNSHYNCPTKCKVIMTVTNSSGETVWSSNINRSYVMKPVTFELRNNISGYVIKIWYWDNDSNISNIKVTNMEKIEHIHEQIIVIAFNSSRTEDFHVKNISLNTILQVCENELNCQPKIENQKYSLNVIDIDNDGYRELVSVMVTFKLVNSLSLFSTNDKHSLELISKVNVFQLEGQLIQDFENGIFV